MAELFERIFSLSSKEVLADVHGGLSMFALILFGAALALLEMDKVKAGARWLKVVMLALWVDVLLLDIFGLYIYIDYRVKGGPRSTLLASESTAWLHQIIFEHKEFLAFAPLILVGVATVIVFAQGDGLAKNRAMKWTVVASVVLALLFLLIVAAEAVLVTKAAPLR